MNVSLKIKDTFELSLPIRDSAHGLDMAPFTGDLSQREKLSEIKPPLALRRLLVETGYKYFLFFVSFIINIPDMISCPIHAILWHNSFLLCSMYVLHNWLINRMYIDIRACFIAYWAC